MDRIRKRKYEDIKGRKFGKLTAVEFIKETKDGFFWAFKCDCGNTFNLYDTMIKIGIVKDCGCTLPQKVGKAKPVREKVSDSPIYHIWAGMRNRCYKKSTPCYKNYGGRGITVCDEWRFNSKAFIEWAVNNGWEKGKSIDRIDNNGKYEPSNCRWATVLEQARNTRANIIIEYNGETKTLPEWCEEIGLNYSKTYARIKKGMSPHDAFYS